MGWEVDRQIPVMRKWELLREGWSPSKLLLGLPFPQLGILIPSCPGRHPSLACRTSQGEVDGESLLERLLPS